MRTARDQTAQTPQSRRYFCEQEGVGRHRQANQTNHSSFYACLPSSYPRDHSFWGPGSTAGKAGIELQIEVSASSLSHIHIKVRVGYLKPHLAGAKSVSRSFPPSPMVMQHPSESADQVGGGSPQASALPPYYPARPPAPPARAPPRRVDHTYRDYSNYPMHELTQGKKVPSNFPSKLHQILSTPEYSHVSYIICIYYDMDKVQLQSYDIYLTLRPHLILVSFLPSFTLPL